MTSPREGGRVHGTAVGLSYLVVAVWAVAALLAGCSAPSDPGPVPAGPATSTAPAPVRVDVPAVDAHSTLTQVDLGADHELQTPPVTTPGQAAWYRRSEPAGATGGIPTVIVGHINGNGQPGVFAHLAGLPAGAEVDVARADGTTAVFTVRRVDVVAKDAFPTAAVYSAVPGSSLRLISCGGDLDVTAHSYVGQVIAYADETGTRRT